MRYTDPDVALAQADEDKLLGFDPPQLTEVLSSTLPSIQPTVKSEAEGKFMALQIHLQLGTACYATMALREITKSDTSSGFQTALTSKSKDQKYRAGGTGDEAERMDIVNEEEEVAAELETLESPA